MNNAVRSLRTTYVYARSSARDIATNIYRVYSAALNLVRVSPAHGEHYLNFNHNFAGARHAYAKCVLKGKGRRRQRDDERKRARERERYRYIYLHLYIDYAAIKAHAICTSNSAEAARLLSALCRRKEGRDGEVAAGVKSMFGGPNLCQRFSMCALCKYVSQQVERTCHTDRLSIVSLHVVRVVVVIAVVVAVAVAVVFSL